MIPATADVSLANACRGCGFSSRIKERHKDLVMNRYFIQLLLLALCVAAPAQSLKDLEKAHKDKMKELKKSLGLKKVEIRQEDDGTYYMLLTSKDKHIGRADINGNVILPAAYYGINKSTVFDSIEVFTLINGLDRIGIADISGKVIVPAEYSNFIFCPAIKEGKSWAYDNQDTRTGDSVVVYHEAAPAVIYAKGNISRIYSMTGEVLRDSIMTDRCAYIPGYFITGTETLDVKSEYNHYTIRTPFSTACGLFSQSGEQLVAHGAERLTIYGESYYYDKFKAKYGKERNWCTYTVKEGMKDKMGGFIFGFENQGIPALFWHVTYEPYSDKWSVKRTELGKYEDYTAELVKQGIYRDKGEEYYEKREFDKVISFYAKEGVNKPWAKFFTAMALYNKALYNVTIANMISENIEKNELSYDFLKNMEFDLDLATEQYNTSVELFDVYLKEDSTYQEDAVRWRNIALENVAEIPAVGKRYEAAMQLLKQREAAQAAELQRQQELKRQQNAAFWGGILSAFIQGAANAVTGGGGSGSSGKAAATYSGGTAVSTSSSSGSSSRKASQIAEWEARRRDAESQLAKYKAQQIKDPNSTYLKSVIESTENRIRTCNERINSLRAQ